MKKTIFTIILLTVLSVKGQNSDKQYLQDIDKKHELRLDAFSLIVFSSFDVTYERLLNKDTSLGVSVFYNFNDISSDVYFPKTFSITPFYRWFFSDTRYARGFFVEGFGMLNTFEDEVYFFNSNNFDVERETNFALGVSVGGKFVIRSGFTAEIFIGVGRNLFNGDADNFIDNELVSRGGISLGYRF